MLYAGIDGRPFLLCPNCGVGLRSVRFKNVDASSKKKYQIFLGVLMIGSILAFLLRNFKDKLNPVFLKILAIILIVSFIIGFILSIRRIISEEFELVDPKEVEQAKNNRSVSKNLDLNLAFVYMFKKAVLILIIILAWLFFKGELKNYTTSEILTPYAVVLTLFGTWGGISIYFKNKKWSLVYGFIIALLISVGFLYFLAEKY